MPPEIRTFISKSAYLSALRDVYQYYIPEEFINKHWTDYDYSNFQSTYSIKFDFSSYKRKSKKTLEIE